MAVTATSLASSLSVRQSVDESVGWRHELFRFRFGAGLSGETSERVFRLHIDSLGSAVPDEVWFTNSTVSVDEIGEFTVAECDDYLAAHVEVRLDPGVDFSDLTTQIYCELLRLAHERGYPNLIRAWNYFPGINQGQGDLERYRQFTAGRAVAFGEFSYQGEALPAGTAIGTDDGTPLTVSALATRDRCRMIENPRQISAYQYPREYGLSSPSFSRAVVVGSPSGHRILMSGTASIVGHQSMHPGDPVQQTTETLRNLDELIQQARVATQTPTTTGRTLTDGYWRIYVRRPEQVEKIERALRNYLVDDSSLIFLRGDICRHELLLEIEAAGVL